MSEKSLIDEDFVDDDDLVVDIENEDDEVVVEEEQDEKPAPKASSHEDELDNVDDRVKARIAALRKQAETERAARERVTQEAKKALTTAARIRAENEQLKGLYSHGEKAFVAQMRESLDNQLTGAKKALKDAMEIGDAEAAAEANAVVADLIARRREVESYRETQFEATPELPDIERTFREVAPKVEPDTRALEWQSQNTWFGRDEEMTALALATHRRLVKEGIHPINNADRYYQEIDAQMRRRFQDRFEDQKKPVAKKTPPTAPVTHQIVKGKKVTKVKLSERQVQLAQNLGLTPQQYAEAYIKELNGE